VYDKSEIRISGRAVSRGVATGTIVCLFGTRRQFFRRSLTESEIESEVARVEQALAESVAKIETELAAIKATTMSSLSAILQTHQLILTDPILGSGILNNVTSGRMNAEWATQTACDSQADGLSTHSDPHLAEKRLDVEDVCDRILSCLGTAEGKLDLSVDSIIAAREISPSMLLRLSEKGIVATISESGGWTSHTSILARELGIPSVTGIREIFDHFESGQHAMVDGNSGEVTIHSKTVSGASKPAIRKEFLPPIRQYDSFSTIDERVITIRTNTTTVDGYHAAASLGAKGIGLYRSESLIGSDGIIPNEDQQTAAYEQIAKAVGSESIRIRTFDLDASQFDATRSLRQKNPALGLRAIRLGLTNVELMRTQARALLRASVENQIGVVVPMVTGVSDVVEVREIVDTEANRLETDEVAVGHIEIGAMIEVPSAVFVIDQLAARCDFFCLGTNDLAQYLLAADRDNEAVSKWFRTLHPAMLRAVRCVIDECRAADKPLVVCGEMAGSPFYVPVLIGLGATELSMNPNSIAAVSRIVNGIRYSDAVELVRDLETLSDADDMERIVTETAQSKWEHLFQPGFLENQSS